ncbi:Transposase IS116/IS110/IS902 family protein [Planctomycetes bacterium CA13]|uniref:Transposase IS116/IS110/IS902 family protein n=2 Tax=Novipirellula herctigrandis TaxID=2527986 RepID=A0A5C5YV77_9BACT|nr:Transposase IS116/IS110/IS902 family protein [Planctomycetes bacterium CA13]TWT79500.1 Transposase IS116/IS110/IS902 family protein [Planctomycetes bacterium CA13]
MMICSLDLGKFKSVACFYDCKTRKFSFEAILTRRSHIDKLLDDNEFDLLVMEACGPSGWISDVCQQREIKTLVCSTNDEAWMWNKTKRKTDRDDALKLAKMAAMGVLTPVHVPKPEIREQRAIIKYRKNLDGRITRIKNGIRSTFANRGIEIDTGARAWNTGRVHIDSFRKSIAECTCDDLWKGQLDLELTQLDALTAEMQAVEDRLELFAADNPLIQIVMTIPGVGRKTAELLVAIIDDPHRFKSARHLSSYLGLTPKQYQSGETDRNGKISKRGPKLARTMLLECAWASLRYNAWSKKTFERIHGGSKTRRKKAGIALARKIAVVAWAMMRDQQAWDQSKALQEAVTDPGTQELMEEATEPHEAKPKKKAKLLRAKPHPPGPVISDEPKQRSGRGSKPTRRRGSKRRSPLKT